ncbi:MAG: ABC transporter substrate-binding protein [Congregibacter sp.]
MQNICYDRLFHDRVLKRAVSHDPRRIPRHPPARPVWSRVFVQRSVAWVFAIPLLAAMLGALSLPSRAEPGNGHSRVISTDAAITAIIDALGQADRLVGIDVTSEMPTGLTVARVGYHRALTAEGLLSLSPQLMIVSTHAGPRKTLEAVQRLGVEVVALEPATDLDSLRENIQRIAQAVNADDALGKVLADLETQQTQLAKLASPRPLAAVLVREGEGGLRVAGEGSAGDALLRLSGARNAVEFSGYRSYSQESLLALEPEAILVALDAQQSLETWIDRYPLIRFSEAYTQDRVLAVPAASLVGGVSLTAIELAVDVAQQLKPDTADSEVSAVRP